MGENRTETELTPKERSLANLKRDAGPGRPPGRKNFNTLVEEALIKIAEANKMTLEEMEVEFQKVGVKNALKGNFQFWKDINDRRHGKTPDITHHTVEVKEPSDRVKALAEKLNK